MVIELKTAEFSNALNPLRLVTQLTAFKQEANMATSVQNVMSCRLNSLDFSFFKTNSWIFMPRQRFVSIFTPYVNNFRGHWAFTLVDFFVKRSVLSWIQTGCSKLAVIPLWVILLFWCFVWRFPRCPVMKIWLHFGVGNAPVLFWSLSKLGKNRQKWHMWALQGSFP